MARIAFHGNATQSYGTPLVLLDCSDLCIRL